MENSIFCNSDCTVRLFLHFWMRNNVVWLRRTRLYFKYWTCRSEKTFKSLIMKYDYILIDCKAVEILLYLCVCWPVFFCGSSLRSDLWVKHPVDLQGLDRDRQRQIELSSLPNQTIFGGPCDYCGNCNCNNHKTFLLTMLIKSRAGWLCGMYVQIWCMCRSPSNTASWCFNIEFN